MRARILQGIERLVASNRWVSRNLGRETTTDYLALGCINLIVKEKTQCERPLEESCH